VDPRSRAACLGVCALASACADDLRFVPLPPELSAELFEEGTALVRPRGEARVFVDAARGLRLDDPGLGLDVYLSREPATRLGLATGWTSLRPASEAPRVVPGVVYGLEPGAEALTPLIDAPPLAGLPPLPWADLLAAGGCSARSRDDDGAFVAEPQCPASAEPDPPTPPTLLDLEVACLPGFARVRGEAPTTTFYRAEYTPPDRELTLTRRWCRAELPEGCPREAQIPGGCVDPRLLDCAPPPPDAAFVDVAVTVAGDGSAARPFASLEAALAAGRASIILRSGRYRLPELLPAAISIAGECRAEVVLVIESAGARRPAATRLELADLVLEAAPLDAELTVIARRVRASTLEALGVLELDGAWIGRLLARARAEVHVERSVLGRLESRGVVRVGGSTIGDLEIGRRAVTIERSLIRGAGRLRDARLDLRDVEWKIATASVTLSLTTSTAALDRVAFTADVPFDDGAVVLVDPRGVFEARDLTLIAPAARDRPTRGSGLVVAAGGRATLERAWIEALGADLLSVARTATVTAHDLVLLAAGDDGVYTEGTLTLSRGLIAGSGGDAIDLQGGVLRAADLLALWNRATAVSAVEGDAELTRLRARGTGDGAVVVGSRATVRLTHLAASRPSQSACVGRCSAALLIDAGGALDLQSFVVEGAERGVRVYPNAALAARAGRIMAFDGFTFTDDDPTALHGMGPFLEQVRVDASAAPISFVAP
jgi:hypothetical protein